MLQTLDLNLCCFQLRAWRLIPLPLSTSVFKPGLAQFCIFQRPCPYLLVANLVLSCHLTVIFPRRQAILDDCQAFFFCRVPALVHVTPAS